MVAPCDSGLRREKCCGDSSIPRLWLPIEFVLQPRGVFAAIKDELQSRIRMTNSQRQSKARECFLHWLALRSDSPSSQLSPTDELNSNYPIIREGMVIREDFFLGRRFVTEEFDAIWFIEEDQLKVFGNDGGVLAVMDNAEIDKFSDDYHKQHGQLAGEHPQERRAA